MHLGTVLKRLSNSSKRADSSILCSFRLPGWISFHDRQKPRMPKPFTPSKVNIAVVPWPGKAKDTCHHHQQPFPGRVFPVACRNLPYFLVLRTLVAIPQRGKKSTCLMSSFIPCHSLPDNPTLKTCAFIACPIVTPNFDPQPPPPLDVSAVAESS